MKTTILASMVVVLGLSQTAQADTNNNLFSYQLGYSLNTVQTAATKAPETGGVYMNVDFMGSSSSGFGIGMGFDLNAWDGRPAGRYSTTPEMTLGGTLKTGYTFQNTLNLPLKLKAGIGYGYMKNVFDSGWGIHYEAGGEFLLYKNLGIGAKYKYAEADMMNTTVKNNSTIFYLMFGY